MTDGIMAAANNAARFAGGNTIGRRWIDIADPKPEDIRTADEVIGDLRERMDRDFGSDKRGETP